MLSRLREIYQDKLIEDIVDLSSDYYYFYKDSSKLSLFGISKAISSNEYELLKSQYVEKKLYTLDKTEQSIYEYLLEGKNYPFKEKKLKTIIYSLKLDDEVVVENMIKEVYDKAYFIKLFNLNVCFLNDDKIKVRELFDALSSDVDSDIILHEGLIISKKYSGSSIYSYIKAFNENDKLHIHSYSDLADAILNLDVNIYKELLESLKDNLFNPLFLDINTRDIINVMFKNDLNVSQSAKLLYMNRNSLINKLDSIYKDTGLNLQKFTHASIIYMMMNLT